MLSIIKQGLARMWAHKRLILFFYFANLITAALIILPLRAALNRFAGHSQMADRLRYGMDADLLIEFLQYSGETIGPILLFGLLAAILYWLLTLYLSGGALKLFASGRQYDAALFWGSAGRYFGRFLRLFLWSLLVLLILLLLPQIITLLQRLIFGKDPYEYITYYSGFIRLILYVIGVFFYLMVFDYGRIQIISSEERATRKALWRALVFIRDHFGRVVLLSLIFALTGTVGFFIYYFIADLLNGSIALTIALIFILQQLFMLFRAALRLTGFASETVLYQKYVMP
ncbi:hypothetical protein JXO59_14345 [candidate division KSB1 bacterium]|nr:hypothetical protein [candidate division KSB1 bacterium]